MSKTTDLYLQQNIELLNQHHNQTMIDFGIYIEEAIADLKELIQRILDNEHIATAQKLSIITEIVKIEPIKTHNNDLPF
jgi:uncharacterized HAD superfamily protein